MRCSIMLLMMAGCFPDFDPASHVVGLRVMAIKAEPPELAPGQTALLTPLWDDTRGADAGTPTLSWSLCLQAPPPGSAVSKDCLGSDGGDVTAPLGDGPTMQVTMPELTADQLGIPDSTGGVYLPVILRISDGAETVTAVYRLRYTSPLVPAIFTNHNPHIEDILVAFERDAGTRPLDEFEIHHGDRVGLRASLPDADHEQYPQIEGKLPSGGISLDGGIDFFDGGLQVGDLTLVLVHETLRVSWFTTIGTFSPDVTGGVGKLDTSLRMDKYLVDPPADIDIYVVVRDDRGGTDFTQRKLLLR